MSDDESPEAPPAEEAPRRKRKARPAASTSAKAPVRAAVVAPAAASQWTTGHVAAALALGLALGGMGGYLFSGNKSAPSATAESAKPAQSGPAAAAKPGPPTAGAYVPLAAWTPREGPEQAKVTIVEFSDFQ